MGIPDHLTCLLGHLYRSRSNRTEHETMYWFQIGKGVHQSCIVSPCLFNFYVEHVMQNAGWMNHKLESRLWGEISTTSYMQMMPLKWQKVADFLLLHCSALFISIFTHFSPVTIWFGITSFLR